MGMQVCTDDLSADTYTSVFVL